MQHTIDSLSAESGSMFPVLTKQDIDAAQRDILVHEFQMSANLKFQEIATLDVFSDKNADRVLYKMSKGSKGAHMARNLFVMKRDGG